MAGCAGGAPLLATRAPRTPCRARTPPPPPALPPTPTPTPPHPTPSALPNQVRCKGSLEGKVALEADHAAAALVAALTPGWLFPVRAEAVLDQLKAALAAGARPSRLHAILSRARLSNVEPSIIDAAAAQLGPAARRAPARPKPPSMPAGLAWRKLARQMNGTYDGTYAPRP